MKGVLLESMIKQTYVCSQFSITSDSFGTPWTVAHQAPLSMGFSRQEYWVGLPFPVPQDLPDPGVKTCIFCVSCIGRQILYHCAKEWFWGEAKKQTWKLPGGSDSKESSCSAKTWVRSLGREGSLEKGMATHSSILAWRIPWTEEPGGLQSMGSQRVGHDWALTLFQTTNILHYFSPSAYLVLCWTS